MSPSSKPRILIPACNRQLGEHAFHTVGKKYADAARLAGGLPLLLPNLQADEIEPALDVADGILLTGSPANVHPDRFAAWKDYAESIGFESVASGPLVRSSYHADLLAGTVKPGENSKAE